MAGINRALSENRYVFKANEAQGKPCIFLSHISIDKADASAFANYIMRYGNIDVYLDIADDELQRAVHSGEAHRITQFVERGLASSTHIMCLVSGATVRSWWVPYELGFAKNVGKHLATLKLKGDITLPEYLQISELIRGTTSLNDYLSRVRYGLEKLRKSVSLSESLMAATASPHPLDEHLNWNQ